MAVLLKKNQVGLASRKQMKQKKFFWRIIRAQFLVPLYLISGNLYNWFSKYLTVSIHFSDLVCENLNFTDSLFFRGRRKHAISQER